MRLWVPLAYGEVFAICVHVETFVDVRSMISGFLQGTFTKLTTRGGTLCTGHEVHQWRFDPTLPEEMDVLGSRL